MKRLFTTLLVCVLALPLCAQVVKAKKVAILEVVDREGSINYGVKLQLRSSLTSAITQTAGYEGYDRVDMAAIFGEHDFQRTGVVSNDQIKKLGEMSGCDYVLITEAASLDDNNLILVAKVVNVTTGKVEANADTMITANTNSIRNGGQELAGKLLKPATPAPQNDSTYNTTQSQTDNYGSTGQTRTTKPIVDIEPRSKKTRFIAEGGLGIIHSINLMNGVSWGWQLNQHWFVGFFGYFGNFNYEDYYVHLGMYDVYVDNSWSDRYTFYYEECTFDCFLGITTKAHFSKKKKSMYCGCKIGVSYSEKAPLLGIELGYDFGKISTGLSAVGTIYGGDCFVGPIVCYNF